MTYIRGFTVLIEPYWPHMASHIMASIGSRNHEPLLNPWNTILWKFIHNSDVIMGMMASQITSLTIVYLTVYSGGDQRQHQSSASLAFVRGIHRWPLNSPHKWPVTRKMFPFDDIIMKVHKSSSRSGRLFHNQGAQLHFRVLKAFSKERQGFNPIIILAP